MIDACTADGFKKFQFSFNLKKYFNWQTFFMNKHTNSAQRETNEKNHPGNHC